MEESNPKVTSLMLAGTSTAHVAYKLTDCWKAARHCRDTMHAYQILRDKEMSVDQVVAVQKQYKEHMYRCAIDAADGASN